MTGGGGGQASSLEHCQEGTAATAGTEEYIVVGGQVLPPSELFVPLPTRSDPQDGQIKCCAASTERHGPASRKEVPRPHAVVAAALSSFLSSYVEPEKLHKQTRMEERRSEQIIVLIMSHSASHDYRQQNSAVKTQKSRLHPTSVKRVGSLITVTQSLLLSELVGDGNQQLAVSSS